MKISLQHKYTFMDIRPQVTTQISKSFLVEYTELIEELDGMEENENLN